MIALKAKGEPREEVKFRCLILKIEILLSTNI